MSILEKINSPADLKRLDRDSLPALAEEIRRAIISATAESGGHLASNLGMVEAEIALHRVFDCPNDSIVFDVGHQAYAHKLLTGRRAGFSTLRQNGGISGFTNRSESEYDVVTAGHSGTALSTAVGIAEANRLDGRDSWTVAVVGDGALTNGMVYEALNQLEARKLRLVILLNDNQMSISKNVGGVSKYLSSVVRTSRNYFVFKMRLKRICGAIPLIGKGLVIGATRVRDFIKRLLGAETWFESMGLDYIGPVNGNDINKISSVLAEAKHKGGPVVVHMITTKGLGYAPAEERPDKFHSTAPFNEADGSPKGEKQRTFTDEFSDMLCERAENDDSIVAITAAMTAGCGLSRFRRKFPDRFYDVGIAEEHAVTFASGLALGGKTPVLVMYSTFSQRVFDQLWHDFCLQNKNKNDLSLILMLSHAGLVPGDGVTHHGIFDVSLISRLPDVTVYSPDTFADMRTAFDHALECCGLTVVRYPKGEDSDCTVPFEHHGDWKVCTLGEGGEYELVVTYGRIVKNVIDAARRHASATERCDSVTGRAVKVVVLEKIVPLPDDDDFAELVALAERVAFVEEGVASGGIGEHFAASRVCHVPVSVVAIDDSYIRCGSIKDVLRRARLDTDSLAERLGWRK